MSSLDAMATERRLVEQFLVALRALPGVSAELEPCQRDGGRPERQLDAQVVLTVAGKPVTLLIEVKKALYPRDVRQTLWQFKEFSRGLPKAPRAPEVVFVLIADSISPGAQELLRDEWVGYYDSGGSLFLPARGMYLYIDKPMARVLSRSLRSLFSRRRAQVVHALLTRPRNWFGVIPLAKRAGVSPATASQVLTELERLDWMVSRGRGPNKERYLNEPAALLDEWAKQLNVMQFPAMRRYYVPATPTDALIQRFGRVFGAHRVEYAITHEAAAQCYAPFLSRVSQVRCRLVASPAADEAIDQLGARRVTEGTNLVVMPATSPGELLFRERVDGIWLASPIQVYLDLVHSEGRAKEMADHLRRESIGY